MGKRINYFTNLIYFIVLSLFVVLRICAEFGLFDFMGASAGYVMSFITQFGLIFLLPVVLFKIFNKTTYKDTFGFLGFRKISLKMILICIILGIVIFFLNVYVSSFFNSIIQFFGYRPRQTSGALDGRWWVFILDLITTAVLPAICEETLHRGMLLKGNASNGMFKSIMISGFLFGLLHLNIEQFFYASIIGLFFGYLCWGCNSIYPCMILHFMNNGISVFLSFARARGWAIGNIFGKIAEFLSINNFLGIILFVLFLVLLFVIAKDLVSRLFKESFNVCFAKRQKELTNMAIRENYFKQIEEIKNNKQPNSIYTATKNTIYIDFKDFMEYIGKTLDKIDKTEQNNNKISNIELKTKILLYGSFVLSSIVTIMSFIWGLFR